MCATSPGVPGAAGPAGASAAPAPPPPAAPVPPAAEPAAPPAEAPKCVATHTHTHTLCSTPSVLRAANCHCPARRRPLALALLQLFSNKLKSDECC